MKKLLLLTSALTLLGVPWANADVEVEIVNGSSSTGWLSLGANTCALPVLPDTCSTGTMTVGNYTVASDIGIMSNGTNPFLDLSYDAHTTDATPGSITFYVIATGFTSPIAGTYIVANGNGTIGGTATVTTYGGNANTDCLSGMNACTPSTSPANLTPLETIGGLNTNNFNVSQGGGGGNTVNPYALAIALTLNSPTNVGGASGDVQLDATPEPASVMLLGGMLVVLGFVTRRKLGRSA